MAITVIILIGKLAVDEQHWYFETRKWQTRGYQTLIPKIQIKM